MIDEEWMVRGFWIEFLDPFGQLPEGDEKSLLSRLGVHHENAVVVRAAVPDVDGDDAVLLANARDDIVDLLRLVDGLVVHPPVRT